MRLLVAIAGASLAMPVVAFPVAVGFTVATGDLSWSGRSLIGNPLFLLLVAGIVVLPPSFAVVVVLLVLVCTVGGALTGAVYWLLLDPPTYYRDR